MAARSPRPFGSPAKARHVRLDLYSNEGFSRGKPAIIEALWLLAQWFVLSSSIPGSVQRRLALRLFGARIGTGVIIKTGVRVKFPWRLTVGDHTWIGEDTWIDNLAGVSIGSHCCLSQGTYLCTGNHDWSVTGFDLRAEPVRICDRAWLAAHSVVAPGVTVGEDSVLTLGSIATRDLLPSTVNSGSPAKQVGWRGRARSTSNVVRLEP